MKQEKILLHGKSFREWKDLIDKELPYLENFLINIAVEDLYFSLKEESLQIIALVFSCLPPKKMGPFLKKFEMPLPIEIIRKSAKMGSQQQESIKLLIKHLDLKIQSMQSSIRRQKGGVKQAALILSQLDSKSRNILVEKMDQRNKSTSERIVDSILTFEDIIHLPAIEISGNFSALSKLWSIALRRTTPELRKHILSSLSQRAAANLEMELLEKIPIRMAEVESAQRIILDQLKPLLLLALDKTT